MSDLKKFAFDVGITFIASIIAMLFGFVMTVLFSRYLGAGDLGLYRMVSTIYGIMMLFAAIGIPAAIINYVAEFKGDRSKVKAHGTFQQDTYIPAVSRRKHICGACHV